MKNQLFVGILFLSVFNLASSAKILAILTAPAKSHAILTYELLKELVKFGHEVNMKLNKQSKGHFLASHNSQIGFFVNI